MNYADEEVQIDKCACVISKKKRPDLFVVGDEQCSQGCIDQDNHSDAKYKNDLQDATGGPLLLHALAFHPLLDSRMNRYLKLPEQRVRGDEGFALSAM